MKKLLRVFSALLAVAILFSTAGCTSVYYAAYEKVGALVKAATQRLRPILMTTGAMVLGAIPLAFATGAGAESRQQIGWVIVGGMSLGTLLTIFVVPTMYTLFARRTVPGANKTVGKEQVDDGAGALIQPMHPVMGAELVVK